MSDPQINANQDFAQSLVQLSKESYDAGYKAARHDISEALDAIPTDLPPLDYAQRVIAAITKFIT